MTDEISSDQNRITAIGFFIKLWEERLFILVVTLFFLLMGEVYIFVSPEKYTTTILLGHVSSIDNPGASSASSLGGAIALIGLNAGGGTDGRANLFLTLIKTENFARLLQQKYHYDKPHSKTTLPSALALNGVLNQITPTSDGDTLKLTLLFSDKEFAKELLLTVYDEGNQAVRNIDTERAKKFSAFIEDRFRSETSRPMQDALGSLLVNQERFLMVTSVNLPYAVQLLDGPIASERPTSPRVSLLLAISFAVGLAMSLFLILIWDAVISERRGRGLYTPTPSQWLKNTAHRAIRMGR